MTHQKRTGYYLCFTFIEQKLMEKMDILLIFGLKKRIQKVLSKWQKEKKQRMGNVRLRIPFYVEFRFSLSRRIRFDLIGICHHMV